MRPLIASFTAAVALAACAQGVRVDGKPAPPMTSTPKLIPLPSTVEMSGGPPFVVSPATIIEVPAGDERLLAVGRRLSDLIGGAAGAGRLRVEAGGGGGAGRIMLRVGQVPGGDDAYELNVTPDRVTITGAAAAGVFYGVQTFRQLLPPFVEHEALMPDKARPLSVPAGRVADAPRFAWRGAMLDVARHFLTTDEVERYIDLMALHKLNRLHLHLADDQGWRIDITSWPNLAAHGGSTEVGGGPGGYYTQQQYARLVAYAAARFITIVPEIDMPGHTNAALASYPELNCDGKAPPLYTGTEVGFSALCVDKEVTYRFIDDVVREIGAITPGAYFHIGGDEVKTLPPPQYVAFVERVQAIVRRHGKQMIGWDEIAPAALDATSIVQHWRPGPTPKEAVAKGARVIMSVADRAYLDMKYHAATPIGLSWAALIGVQRSYDWDPLGAAPGVPEAALLGVEAPLWTETVANIRDVEFLAFPRLAALAEVAWSRADRRRWDDFRVRLGAQGPRWSALGINFYRSPEVPWVVE